MYDEILGFRLHLIEILNDAVAFEELVVSAYHNFVSMNESS